MKALAIYDLLKNLLRIILPNLLSCPPTQKAQTQGGREENTEQHSFLESKEEVAV